MKISVVIPVYNPGPYIQACVDGLLAQTMPADQFEAIFVDDGSTDDTPALLDQVALGHSHFRVVHQKNSGWPGKPRNVGIDMARGDFVFFCDHDDWLGAEALERMHAYAVQNDADVLIGKMAGIGRAVPHNVFLRTRPHVTLADSQIIDSLTPHKLFRRSFLNRNDLRFPEGRRRLEDHLFVVTAYLLADSIAVYADYTCYYHIRRDDGENAAYRGADWDAYFANLQESLDVVAQHTEPGPLRDRIFRRWLRNEMIRRHTGPGVLRRSEPERTNLFMAAHRTAAAYFGPGVLQQLPVAPRAVGQALIAGDLERVIVLARCEARWQGRCELTAAAWVDDDLVFEGNAALGALSGGGPVTTPEAVAGLVGNVTPEELGRSLQGAKLVLYALQRESNERWNLPVTTRENRLRWEFSGAVDVARLAAGEPLGPGRWDVYVELTALGLRRRVRLELPPGWVGDDRALDRTALLDGHPVALYYTRGHRGLTVAVGRSHEPPERKRAAALRQQQVRQAAAQRKRQNRDVTTPPEQRASERARPGADAGRDSRPADKGQVRGRSALPAADRPAPVTSAPGSVIQLGRSGRRLARAALRWARTVLGRISRRRGGGTR